MKVFRRDMACHVRGDAISSTHKRGHGRRGHGKPCPYVFALCLALAGCAPQNAPQTQVANNAAATTDNIEYSKSDTSNNQIVVGQFLDGKTPLSMRFKELSSDWKRIEINVANPDESDPSRANNDRFPVQLLRETTGARHGVYFTQWKTVAQNDDTFLVCYRSPDFDDSDLRALFTVKNEYSKPDASRFIGAISQWMDKRPLDFVLLNMKNIKVVGNAQAVNWSQSLERVRAWANKNLSSESSTRLSSRERLQLLANATLRFARDNDDTLPPLDDAMQAQLKSYVFDEIWWREPQSDRPFIANAVLSNKKLAHIASPQDMILFYEANADARGHRNASFLDGSARELNAADWEKYRRGSKIP